MWDFAEEPDALVARADVALYESKRAGGGRAVPAVEVPRQRSMTG
jgi:predicted signal transduction protein with EAL and GGDEF domain